MLAALAAALLTAGFVASADASTMTPAPVQASGLTVQATYAGTVATASSSTNIAEPVAIDGALYVVDQGARTISIQGPGGPKVILDESGLPPGLTLASTAGITNIAGAGGKAYVGYFASTLPSGFGTPAPLPDDPAYSQANPRYDLIYSYDIAPDGSLTNPVPLAAFEARTFGHHGGGMLVLPNGDLLYARGDNLNQNYDGLSAPQDDGSTLSKLLVIDGATGAVTVAAKGVRNVQHLTWTDASQTAIAFSDIGWTVAEEINVVSLAELLDTGVVENFGWGRGGDGLAREGTFYVSEGPEAAATVTGLAPLGEAGFVQPFAQFGREDHDGFFAVTGPVASEVSFSSIGLLFGDLVNGSLYATLAGATGALNTVYAVQLLDASGQATTLQALLGLDRVDLRFFLFADGSAGLLAEQSGALYRLTQIAPVPLPATLPLLLLGLAVLARRRQS
ncbi:hypothetical protein [Tropicibacter sp. S64]|uniref:hypothetical protein n=1 Tax=Tropicibacter sp. S64 TaxID=3415122 RepID=UPI003C7A7C14